MWVMAAVRHVMHMLIKTNTQREGQCVLFIHLQQTHRKAVTASVAVNLYVMTCFPYSPVTSHF